MFNWENAESSQSKSWLELNIKLTNKLFWKWQKKVKELNLVWLIINDNDFKPD